MRPGLALFIALLARSVHAQLTQVWERRLPLGTNDWMGYGHSVLLSDRSVVVAGTTMPTSTTREIVVARFAADGTQLWSTVFAPSANYDNSVDLALDPQSGDVLVAGTTRAVAATQSDVRLTRFDASGAVVWTTTLSSGTFDVANRVCVDSAGSVWLLWSEGLTGTPQHAHVFLTGFTPAGAVFVTRTLLDSGFGTNGMSAHPSGGVALAYDSASMQTVYRVDGAGNVLWNAPLTSSGGVYAERRLACDAAGNVLVCGLLQNNAVITKYDVAGNVLWTCAHPAPAGIQEQLSALAVDAQGNAVGVGQWMDPGNYEARTFVMRCSASGALLWSHTSNSVGGDMDSFSDVVLDAAGNPTAIGLTSGPTFPAASVLVRYDRDGAEHAIAQYFGPVGTYTSFRQGLAAGNGDLIVGGVSLPDALLVRFHEQGVPFCLGDGSASACPCGNSSATYDQSGCRYNANSASRLIDQGVARISADSLVLEARGAPSTGPVIFVQGDQRANSGAGVLYGDGLLCLGGNLTRLGTVNASGGVARLGASGMPHVSALGHVIAPGVRTYQAFHRSLASFCTPATMGTSNGLEITWVP